MKIGQYQVTPMSDAIRLDWVDPDFHQIRFSLNLPNSAWKSNRKSRKLESIFHECVSRFSSEIEFRTDEEVTTRPTAPPVSVERQYAEPKREETLARLVDQNVSRGPRDAARIFWSYYVDFDNFINSPEAVLMFEMPSHEESADRQYDPIKMNHSPTASVWYDPEIVLLPKLKDFIYAYNLIFQTNLEPEDIRPHLPEYGGTL